MSEININRLAKDIKNILRDPIENIFYEHDEQNILKGYALIIGPNDTPYERGFYFFEFTFPKEYPFLPPVVKYYTNDGHTRFNPNFYVCGKVCLSILNTWKGEGWSSCQNIRSVLITLQSTLNNKPLLNEPGITEKHRDYKNYTDMLRYKNIEIAILGMLTKKYLHKNFYIFYDNILDYYKKHKDYIDIMLNKIKNDLTNNNIYKFGIYTSEYLVNFNYLERIKKDLDSNL